MTERTPVRVTVWTLSARHDRWDDTTSVVGVYSSLDLANAARDIKEATRDDIWPDTEYFVESWILDA